MKKHDKIDSRHARKPLLNFGGVLLLAILLLGLGLRIWGLSWGLREGLRQGSYHPDEFILIGAATSVDIGSLQLNPHLYNYPSLFIYVISIAFRTASGWGLLDGARVADLYLLARLLSVLFGVATVFAVYLAGSKFYNRNAGLAAAGIMAVMPLHVQYSHYVAVDVPAVFFVAAALAASALLLRENQLRFYLFAGAMAGLAAGTKYNCGMVFLSIVAASLLSIAGGLSHRRKALLLSAAFLAAVVAFIITTPGALLWPDQFLRGLTFEIGHAASGHGYVFQNTGPGWLYTITNSLAAGIGWPLLVLAVLAVIIALIRRRTEALVVLAFVLPYYGLISVSEVRFARYALPLFPPLALLIAAFKLGTWENLATRPRVRQAAAVVLALVGAYTLAYTVALGLLFTQADPRDRAAQWAASYVPAGTTIALPTVPWFYSPPFTPGFGSLSASDRYASMSDSAYRLLADETKDWNVQLLREQQPEYIIVSDYEKIDALRADAPGAREYMSFVSQKYEPVAVFESSVFPPLFRSTTSLPHDMRYPAPRIEVYRLKWLR